MIGRTYYMKKGTVIGIILAVMGIISLAAMAIFLTIHYRDDIFFLKDTKTQQEADAVLQALNEPPTEAPAETETEAYGDEAKEKAAASGSSSEEFIIWVGDSRTVGMGRALDNDNIYIGADGEGYDWLYETGVVELADAIQANPGTPVVFNFGVNDCDDIDKYLDIYRAIEAEYPDTHFYYLSVNPIEPTLCDNVTNEEISDFNNQLRKEFPDQFIDSFTFLQINETVTVDGVHYSEEDYQKIYNFAAAQVAFKEESAG